MKLKYIILSFVLVITIVQCNTSKKIVYKIPSYYTGERKTELMTNLEKGKQLFKKYCSNCHGIFTKGKDSVPNFTNTEIKNYLTAYQTNDAKNHAAMKKLLPEEMSMILTFLQLRKIDSIPSHMH
ncbi:hypothetical protein BH11BAC4_BH11BAC4_20690 [soil metagenome]